MQTRIYFWRATVEDESFSNITVTVHVATVQPSSFLLLVQRTTFFSSSSKSVLSLVLYYMNTIEIK